MSSFFVKIQGIEGDATAQGRVGEIECSRMRHVIDQPVSSTSDPRKLGTSRHGALEFVHGMGKATPALRLAVSDGSNLNTVSIMRMNSADDPVEEITITNARVVRVEAYTTLDGNEPGGVEETFWLTYDSITWLNLSNNTRGGWSTATTARA